jgi:hypothetical protein
MKDEKRASCVAAVALPIGQAELRESGEQINSRQSLRCGAAEPAPSRDRSLLRWRDSGLALQTKINQIGFMQTKFLHQSDGPRTCAIMLRSDDALSLS